MFKPASIRDFNTWAIHKKPSYSTINGREQKTYANAPSSNIKGAFKQKNSSDTNANGVAVYKEAVTYTTWYKADLTSGDALEINGILYEIVGNPENTNLRSRYIVCTLERVSGGS